jgi:queuine tRNA-ribosyltransferase
VSDSISGRHRIEVLRAGVKVVRDVASDEVMHPGVGPRREAEELYVRQSRLGERLGAGPVTVFDVGLGAASNAIAARAASRGGLTIVSFERDLGALECALGEPAAFGLEGEAGAAARALLDSGSHSDERARWILRHGELLAALAGEAEHADVVFWDPFSPRANPELWTVAAFAAMRRVASPSCTLFTYSASTAVRLALLLAGWSVGIGAATGSKQQTTAAAVRREDLAAPLPASWLDRLTLPSTPLPGDAPAGWLEQVRAHPQFELGRPAAAAGAAGSKDPLHGVTLQMIVEALVAAYGWEGLGQRVAIRCFTTDPSVSSSLTFLRRTPWARAKVESLYLYMLRKRRP